MKRTSCRDFWSFEKGPFRRSIPAQTQWAGDDNSFAESHAATFAFPVAKGFHTVTMWFLSTFGAAVYLGYPMMTITHS